MDLLVPEEIQKCSPYFSQYGCAFCLLLESKSLICSSIPFLRKVSYKLIYFLFCLLFFSPASSYSTQNTFPKALLVGDKPVHPDCVCSTQFGDSSRFEPKRVYVDQTFAYDFTIMENIHLDYSKLENNEVGFSYDFYYLDDDGSKEKYDGEEKKYCSFICYRAWSITDDTALVWINHYDTDGNGNFTELGLVRREGDFLINSGEIGGGDRAEGSSRVDFFKDNVLQYRTAATPHRIVCAIGEHFKHEEDEIEKIGKKFCSFPGYFAGELVWENEFREGKPTESKLIGIVLH